MERKDISSSELKEFIAKPTFIDGLSLVVARGKSSHYKKDLQIWSSTINGYQRTNSATLPPFFKEITFVKRNTKFQSKQLEEFLSTMEENGIFELTDDNTMYQISKDAKLDLEQKHGNILRAYIIPINELATLVDEKVGIKVNSR